MDISAPNTLIQRADNNKPVFARNATFIFLSIVLFGFAICIQKPAMAANADITFNPIFDQKTNMVMAHIPLPSTWKLINKAQPEQPSIEGPNGIAVYDFPAKMFNYSNDPYMQQIYQQGGQPMRPPPGLTDLIREDIVPIAEEEGLTYVKHYVIPELATKDKNYNARLYKVMPMKNTFDVLVTEWKDSEGNPSLLILHYNKSVSQNMINWGYYGSYLKAPSAHFKQAKKSLIYALLNTRYNPKQIQAFNQIEAQKAQRSMSAHQTRMQNNQAQFEATQRAITSSNNAVNNSIMETWRNNNAASDRGQRNTINSIRDENTAYDAGSDQSYQVESGTNQYWINNDEKYIPSNDALYDPNSDTDMNQHEWREMEVIDR